MPDRRAAGFALFPLALLAAAGYWLYSHQALVPERYPIHWTLSGQPNGWAMKRSADMYRPLLMGLLLTLTMLVVAAHVVKAEGRVTVRDAVVRLLRGVSVVMAMLFSAIALSPVYPSRFPIAALLPVTLGAVAVLAIPVVRASSEAEALPTTSSSADLWHFGVFYYNPSDPALLVEKRSGLGYTVNFARPIAWVIILASLAIPLIVLYRRR